MDVRVRRRVVAVVLAVLATGLVIVVATALTGGIRGWSHRLGASDRARNQRGEPSATYTVRGRVMMVPIAGRPTTEFQVLHEEIPDFVGATGAVGMAAMVMPFPLAEGVSLDGVRSGDAVELTFGVWWTPGQQGYQVLKLNKLPADTKLNLGGAEGAAGEAGGAGGAASEKK